MRSWAPRASAEPGYLAWNEAVGAEPEASKVPEAGGRKGLLCRRLGCGQGHDWVSHPPLGPPSQAAPSLWPLAHTEHFPTGCSIATQPSEHTLWGRGVLLQGESVRSLSAWLPSRQMFHFILDFQKIGHFFSIVSPGRPPGRRRQDECGTLGTLSTEWTVTFLPQQ